MTQRSRAVITGREQTRTHFMLFLQQESHLLSTIPRIPSFRGGFIGDFNSLVLAHQLATMSSSITIPSRTTFGESSKAAEGRSSSSTSSYSSSPRTPQQQQQASSPATSSSKYGHDRRPSLLSELTFPSFSSLFYSVHD